MSTGGRDAILLLCHQPAALDIPDYVSHHLLVGWPALPAVRASTLRPAPSAVVDEDGLVASSDVVGLDIVDREVVGGTDLCPLADSVDLHVGPGRCTQQIAVLKGFGIHPTALVGDPERVPVGSGDGMAVDPNVNETSLTGADDDIRHAPGSSFTGLWVGGQDHFSDLDFGDTLGRSVGHQHWGVGGKAVRSTAIAEQIVTDPAKHPSNGAAEATRYAAEGGRAANATPAPVDLAAGQPLLDEADPAADGGVGRAAAGYAACRGGPRVLTGGVGEVGGVVPT
jgi:hypothetical protein